jgi:hypothetical protein
MKDQNEEPNRTTGTRLRSAGNSKLPLASVIPDTETMQNAVKLMKEGVKLKARLSELEDREKEIRETLAAICEAFDLTDGIKHGMTGFQYNGYATRKTLSKEKLLAAGVSAETINAAYTEGEPFLSCKLIAFDLE